MSKYKSTKQHAPIDDNVELPAAIRAAAARSAELHKSVYDTPDDPEKGKEPAKSGELVGEIKDQPTQQPEDNNGSPKREQETPKPQTPPTQKAPEEAPAAAPKGDPKPSDWEHRYNSLKGRYDQQGSTIASMSQRIADMEAIMARMNDAPKVQPQSQPTPAELAFKPIGQEERETFGEDFIDVAQRAAMEKFNPEVMRLNRELQKIQDQLSKVNSNTAKTQQQNIYTYLDSKVENWRAINRSQEFIAWASLPDPFSGVTRIEMLREAFNKGDGPRVLNFFQGFLKDEAATDPAMGYKPDPAPAPGKVPLENFAAPGRAKAPAATDATAPGEKETISRAQIANFYRMKSMGHWRGNPEEERALEARIFEAERDGRIV